MNNVYQNMEAIVGNTPLVSINRYSLELGIKANLMAKLEFFNPTGSIKDRAALKMIEQAEKNGYLKKGDTIVEPTSGNTGIGLAAIGAAKGYKVVLTMPETMSLERRKMLKCYGADIVLTEGSRGMSGAIEKAKELYASGNANFLPSQFENMSNPQAHYETTAVEIWNDLNGKIDVLIAGVGTGGTISGIGKFLKEKNENIKIFAVEPSNSAVLSGENSGSHKIQGIGAGFIPSIYNKNVVDRVIKIDDEDAFERAKTMAKTEGLLVGVSSGAVLKAVEIIMENEEYLNKNIVVILPDTGMRYLSMENFI